MSKTPRTDAINARRIEMNEPITVNYMEMEYLAKALETELAEAKAEIESLK